MEVNAGVTEGVYMYLSFHGMELHHRSLGVPSNTTHLRRYL